MAARILPTVIHVVRNACFKIVSQEPGAVGDINYVVFVYDDRTNRFATVVKHALPDSLNDLRKVVKLIALN